MLTENNKFRNGLAEKWGDTRAILKIENFLRLKTKNAPQDQDRKPPITVLNQNLGPRVLDSSLGY